MKHRTPLALLGLLLSAPGMAQADPPVTPEQVNIEDADTLLVEIAGTPYRIQLPGIDAPESSMNPKLQRDMQRTGMHADTLLPLGRSALNRVQELLPEFRPYRLLFDPRKKDRYGRTPGDLLDADGAPLSERLVREGFAIPAGPAASDRPALREAAASARRDARGLWHSHPEATRAWAGSSR